VATFVLVPGAFLGGWSYDLLRPMLEAEGHKVLTPALSGTGELQHLAGLGIINLDTHIADIVSLIECGDLNEVILCGHSYAGLIITAVADLIPDRISALVYIDAELPTKSGDTLFSLLPIVIPMMIANTAKLGGNMIAPLPSEVFGTAKEYQQWVDSKQTPHPLACFTQEIILTGAHEAVPRRVMIYNATDIGMPTPMPGWYEALRGKPGHSVFGVEGGHLLMIDSARELADILLQDA
jgi:pimeloyl-ACP methyl ester carboxylesterase